MMMMSIIIIMRRVKNECWCVYIKESIEGQRLCDFPTHYKQQTHGGREQQRSSHN